MGVNENDKWMQMALAKGSKHVEFRGNEMASNHHLLLQEMLKEREGKLENGTNNCLRALGSSPSIYPWIERGSHVLDRERSRE